MSSKNIASAAEMLRRGGTLLSEACSECKGVQVRFEGKIICVNCGREYMEKEERVKEIDVDKDTIKDLQSIIMIKINDLLPALREEKDLARQNDMITLIMRYLEVLEKIHNTY